MLLSYTVHSLLTSLCIFWYSITCEMLSQGASKVNISLVVKMADKDRLIKGLHACFFENVAVEDLAQDAAVN